MTPCPAAEILKQLLDAGLTDASLAEVSQHVDGCPACQTVLEELSDDARLRPWKPCGATTADGLSVGPGLARVLGRARPATAAEAADPPDEALPFLGPPRRAGDLGTLGPYAIEAELGRGGMGIVLLGYDAGLQRRVALKVLRPGLSHEKARARFVREAQAAARVKHDHVVGVYAVDNPPAGPPYLVMELLDGATLAGLIRRRGRLEPREAARLALQVADGLEAAHRAGLVHRDVKPDNVLLDTATGRAKLTDFGLARLAELPSGVTQEGTVVGTPAYMSPEQARGAAPEPRSDVYSLGATLYEMLTGEPPFRGAPHMVLQQVCHDEPAPPRRLNDAVPRDLETIVLKAMAKEPVRRYAGAADFRDDLRRWLVGESIRARPVGRVERLWRWCRRKPVVAGLSAALLAVFATGLAGVLWQWHESDAHFREAEQERLVARQNFQFALEAVEQYHTRVSEDRLLNEPGMQPLRKELLETARGFYARFVRERRGDPTARAEFGRALYRLATLTLAIESAAKALEQQREALALQEELLAERPDDPEYQHDLARSSHGLGVLYEAVGRTGDAEAAYEKARELGQRLADSFPDNPAYLDILCRSYSNLGVLYLNGGKLDQAEPADEKALELGRRLTALQPGLPEWRRALARGHNNLAVLQFKRGRVSRAAAALKEQATVLEQLTGDFPTVPEYQRDFARASYNAASLQFRASLELPVERWGAPLAEAEAAIKKSIAAMGRLVRANPAVADYHSTLAHFHLELGHLYQVGGRTAESEQAFTEALSIYERLARDDPKVALYTVHVAMLTTARANVWRDAGRAEAALPAYNRAIHTLEGVRQRVPQHALTRAALDEAHSQRAMALFDLGRYADAVAAWDEALKYDTGNAHHLYEMARALTRARPGDYDPTAAYREHYALAAREADAVTAAASNAPRGCATYQLACVYALAAAAVAGDDRQATVNRAKQAERYAARAVTMLRRAARSGFFRPPGRRERLQNDRELDGLRRRDDFRFFLAELEAEPKEK